MWPGLSVLKYSNDADVDAVYTDDHHHDHQHVNIWNGSLWLDHNYDGDDHDKLTMTMMMIIMM